MSGLNIEAGSPLALPPFKTPFRVNFLPYWCRQVAMNVCPNEGARTRPSAALHQQKGAFGCARSVGVPPLAYRRAMKSPQLTRLACAVTGSAGPVRSLRASPLQRSGMGGRVAAEFGKEVLCGASSAKGLFPERQSGTPWKRALVLALAACVASALSACSLMAPVVRCVPESVYLPCKDVTQK